jgi:hypothetical protein
VRITLSKHMIEYRADCFVRDLLWADPSLRAFGSGLALRREILRRCRHHPYPRAQVFDLAIVLADVDAIEQLLSEGRCKQFAPCSGVVDPMDARDVGHCHWYEQCNNCLLNEALHRNCRRPSRQIPNRLWALCVCHHVWTPPLIWRYWVKQKDTPPRPPHGHPSLLEILSCPEAYFLGSWLRRTCILPEDLESVNAALHWTKSRLRKCWIGAVLRWTLFSAFTPS